MIPPQLFLLQTLQDYTPGERAREGGVPEACAGFGTTSGWALASLPSPAPAVLPAHLPSYPFSHLPRDNPGYDKPVFMWPLPCTPGLLAKFLLP